MNFTVSNARSVDSKTLFALVDVEVAIAGIAFEIFGIQARREPGGCTSIRLPTYKGRYWRLGAGNPAAGGRRTRHLPMPCSPSFLRKASQGANLIHSSGSAPSGSRHATKTLTHKGMGLFRHLPASAS